MFGPFRPKDFLSMSTDTPTLVSRRQFARAGVGVGFAAATLPIAAQTEVRTDSAGLEVGEVMIDVQGFQVPVYRAMPAARRNLPVVLVVSEIFGVHEHVADVARRFARAGYLALAPELFVRQGDAGSFGEVAKLVAEVVSQTPDAQVMADLDACVAWARANGGDAHKLAVTGFCWGGRITWLYAAHQPLLKAAVAWYGKLASPATPLQPTRPLDVAARLRAPVLGLYGAEDDSIPVTDIERMKAALAGGNAAAKKSAFVVYPDAPHAFHADYRPTYRKAAAEDGWKRCLDWFKSQGVA
jgi:carboxymethylenebutenolidase